MAADEREERQWRGGEGGGPWAPRCAGSDLDTGQAVLEGAHGAVAALLAASREAANLLSDVGTGEGAPLAGRALPVQTSGRAACLWGNTWVRARLWPALPRGVTSIPTPCPHDLLPHPSTHPPVAPQLCPQ